MQWGKAKICTTFWLGDFVRRDILGDLHVYGRTILKLMLEKLVVMMWSGWNWLTVMSIDRLLC
jgi:hypothetical protein